MYVILVHGVLEQSILEYTCTRRYCVAWRNHQTQYWFMPYALLPSGSSMALWHWTVPPNSNAASGIDTAKSSDSSAI